MPPFLKPWDDAGVKIVLAAVLALPLSVLAQDAPVPKILKGMQGQKGQYQVEFLEGTSRAGGRTPPTMTICTENLMDQSKGAQKPKAESKCTHKVLKDTSDEAVMETACPDRTVSTTIKRENARTLLMTVASKGAKSEPQTMKMRYTHLGACREGQGTVSLDPNSEQCRKIKQRTAAMDPAKQCARQKGDREACEQRIRDAVKQLSAMCG
jgi:hypothetical protein